MFRNRTSCQKPGDELYAEFKANFGSVVGQQTTSPSEEAITETVGVERQSSEHGGIKDHDPTPRAVHEPWRYTPSLMDPNSFAFSSFANQPPGYYTPTPGLASTLYHNQAGDLHTPGMGIGIGGGMGLATPLSMPTSDGGLHAVSMMDFSAYGQGMQLQQFHHYNPFGHHEQPQHPTSYAPASFMHQDTGYETMDHDGSPLTDDQQLGSMDTNLQLQHQSPTMSFQPKAYGMTTVQQIPPTGENFRFHVTLNAPTAMIKHADEIPVTYLNKGQAYSVSVVDTAPLLPLPVGTRYRTFVRISFEDEQQRQRPATCWQLWKEGRGTNEAHQRGGKLQAVEYVESNQPAETDDKRTRLELDTASFDGFSVIWTPGVHGSPECNIAVRFNFLSTDFSHSKGVKGIPVRLCAKTQLITDGSPLGAPDSSEVAFCKVKLFRDHGAERKLSNDIAHVKKTIDKLKQQIAQAETGMKDFSKRKRSGSVSKPILSQGPGKMQKHKRTWSMSSASSAGGRVPVEEDLHFKLQTMQDMFTSTRPVSILHLRGAEEDDPDLHPVALVGEPLDLTKVDSAEAAVWQQRSSVRSSSTAETSSLVSPSLSSISVPSQKTTGAPGPTQWTDFQPMMGADTQANPQQLASPPDQITKVARTDESGNLTGWIETLGVDSSYQPPPERPVKPVACFYVMLRDPSNTGRREYYRAVYLMQRTLKDFTNGIAMKWNIERRKIARTLRILDDRGLEVEVDDDVIREMREGQDMIIELSKFERTPSPVKREWDMAVDASLDGEGGDMQSGIQTTGYELRLIF